MKTKKVEIGMQAILRTIQRDSLRGPHVAEFEAELTSEQTVLLAQTQTGRVTLMVTFERPVPVEERLDELERTVAMLDRRTT